MLTSLLLFQLVATPTPVMMDWSKSGTVSSDGGEWALTASQPTRLFFGPKYVAALDFATCEWIIDGKHVPEYRVPPKACELMKKHSLPGERVETPKEGDDGGE